MEKPVSLLLMLFIAVCMHAQPADCVFKAPAVVIDFATGNTSELNAARLLLYTRVPHACPTDGYYAVTSSTADCFGGDWLTLGEDHTPGDADGNMMLVNASPVSGTFFSRTIEGLKGGTTYEFAVWMMNLCRISDKCPFPLLPSITILLQTDGGQTVARFSTGELARRHAPYWKKYRGLFTTPSAVSKLTLTMTDNTPGGCGNDFAMDDITFRECVRAQPVATSRSATPPPKPKRVAVKTAPKKQTALPAKRPLQKSSVVTAPRADSPVQPIMVERKKMPDFPPPPPLLTQRTNLLVRHIETEPGEIRLDLYDNGTIDGDTVSVYHNNILLVSRARLTQNALTFRITVDAANPHHEFVMVAHNLGEIPPNTSLMIVTAGNLRHEVYISSNEQKNAKVTLDLKE